MPTNAASMHAMQVAAGDVDAGWAAPKLATLTTAFFCATSRAPDNGTPFR
jgi:hypothetical protein